MLKSGRVHPVNYDKPLHTAPAGRREAYQVDEGIEDDLAATNQAGDVEVVGKTSNVLSSKRFLLAFMSFVCFLSIITFVLTVAMIFGKIDNRCSCSATMGELQKQGRLDVLP